MFVVECAIIVAGMQNFKSKILFYSPTNEIFHFNFSYVGFYPPDFSLLPFAHEWEPQSRVEDYILGRESGNTVITNADQGYLPGTGSRAVQRRHAKSIVKTKENAYMFKLVQGKDGDRKEFY